MSRPALRVIAAEPSLEARIRQHLADLDRNAEERRVIEAALAMDGRRLADASGLTLRPTVEQMRRMVG